MPHRRAWRCKRLRETGACPSPSLHLWNRANPRVDEEPLARELLSQRCAVASRVLSKAAAIADGVVDRKEEVYEAAASQTSLPFSAFSPHY
jgi:hypothetical protein